MKYIDLKIKRYNSKDSKDCYLSDVINENQIVVLLGSPGSGKTSLLKKFEYENKDRSKYITVKEFIRLSNPDTIENQIILLDGLDQYRSTNIDKSFAITELGNKLKCVINKNQNIHIIISCREIDWYGDYDTTELKSKINGDVSLYSISPLDYVKQIELAKALEIVDPTKFIQDIGTNELMSNPQMFIMIAEIYKKGEEANSFSKKSLYEFYIKNSIERNSEYIINRINKIDKDTFILVTGYLAFFYMFSSIDTFNVEIVQDISKDDDIFSNDNINIVLNSPLFNNKSFCHRTIAEFSCAYFMVNYLLKNNYNDSYARIKSTLILNKKIPTELRSLFAWFCTLHYNEELFDIDPFAQAIYGDPTCLDIESKKRLIEAVREYSKHNPYFYSWNFNENINGLYNESLDEFIIEQFDLAINMKNHYIYFLAGILSSDEVKSSKIIKYIKDMINDEKLDSYIKTKLIDVLKSDSNLLKEILQRIKKLRIADEEDYLKEKILNQLYPDSITPKDIIKYLVCYNKGSIGSCYYLYKTEFKDKHQLVKEILLKFSDQITNYDSIYNYNFKYFIEDYLEETIFKYDSDLTSKQIFDILKDIKQYFPPYHGLSFGKNIFDRDQKLDLFKENLQRLANELFELYVVENYNSTAFKYKYREFKNLFDIVNPNNKTEVLKSLLKNENDKEINLNLLKLIYHESSLKERKKIFKALAKEYNLTKDANSWLKPEIVNASLVDLRKKEDVEKERISKVIKRNEEYLQDLKDDEILNNISILKNVHYYYFVSDSTLYINSFKKGTFIRLRKIIKKLMLIMSDNVLLNIESLAINAFDANREIDRLYYISTCFNKIKDYKKIKNDSFLKYLYVCSIKNDQISNTVKGKFLGWIESEKNDFCLNTLQEYILLLVKHHVSPYKKCCVINLKIHSEKNISVLKRILWLPINDENLLKDTLLLYFLKAYGFSLDTEELNEIIGINNINNDLKVKLYALLKMKNAQREKYEISEAISLYELLEFNNQNQYKDLSSENKVILADLFFSVFNSEKSLDFNNGIMSSRDQLVRFISGEIFKYLEINDLDILIDLYNDNENIWKDRLLYYKYNKDQALIDSERKGFSIARSREFIFFEAILDYKDFFTYVINKIIEIKNIIEANRHNDKDSFYSIDEKIRKSIPKDENSCRDVIRNRLEDINRLNLTLARESLEADNRVDINIKYRANLNYEIQVECKKDSNNELMTGINDQIISKYLKTSVIYGIYLVFIFEKNTKITELKSKLEKTIPENYKENISVICIDFRYPERKKNNY